MALATLAAFILAGLAVCIAAVIVLALLMLGWDR